MHCRTLYAATLISTCDISLKIHGYRILTQVTVSAADEVMGLSCVQVKAAEKYRDDTNASTDVKARARYTNGEACISDVLPCSAACTSHCLQCLIRPAALHQQKT